MTTGPAGPGGLARRRPSEPRSRPRPPPTPHGTRSTGRGVGGARGPRLYGNNTNATKSLVRPRAPSGPRERSRPRPPRPDAGETLREPDSARAASRGQSPWRSTPLRFRPQGRTAEAAERGLAAPLSQRKEAERFAAAKLVLPAAGRQPRRLQNLPSWRRRWLQAARRGVLSAEPGTRWESRSSDCDHELKVTN